MARPLTNKQVAALEVLRRHPEGVDAQTVSDAIPDETCAACGGTGDPQLRDHEEARRFSKAYPNSPREATQCGRCYGHGTRRFDYPMAYQALQKLVKAGLATRRSKLDEWGDPIGGSIVYEPVVEADPGDPLEQQFALPAAKSHCPRGHEA